MRSTNTMKRSAGLMLGLGMGLSIGCLAARPDPAHCLNLEGDRTCAELYPGELMFCSTCVFTPSGDGCVADRPENDACYSPCGGGAWLDDDGSCVAGSSSSSGSEGSTTSGETTGTETGSESASSTTGPMPCVSDEECTDADAPFCGTTGECGTCEGAMDPNGACAGIDAMAPLCVGGTCVQCTAVAPEACVGETPVCDDATNTCVPCVAHDQCGEAACNLFTGACLPGDAVVHVGPAQMFATLADAVDSFAAGAEGTIVVHQGTFNEAVTVDGGRVLALLASGGDVPLWLLAPSTSPQLVVGDATVLLDGLELSGNGSSAHPGMRVDGGRAWVDRGRIVTNLGGGIVAQAGAELVLRNCFVGGDVSNTDAFIINGSTATITYTTVLAGDGGLGQSRALVCDPAANATVRNSMLVAIDDVPELSCSAANVSHSATELATPGLGNVTLGNIQAGWFVDEANDFHLLSPPAAVVTTAQWEDGDPLVDIDGDSRPGVDGLSDAAGADVP